MSTGLSDWMYDHRLTIVVGHSGSGKTEFSVNLAVALAQVEKNTVLADLDIVNPYFRSRERSELFKKLGIRLITSSQACADADVPSMPAELNAVIQNQDIRGVLDIGGDRTGARVLARYRPQLSNQSCKVLFVLNANRPLTYTPEAAATCLREIEETIGLPISGIVNNTHLCNETMEDDIYWGAWLSEELSKNTGIPIVCHVVHRLLMRRIKDLPQPIFPVRLFMRKPWEDRSGII